MLAVDSITKALNDFPDIKVAILFGSATRDRLTPDSDIDIAVAGEQPLALEMKATLVAHLSQRVHHVLTWSTCSWFSELFCNRPCAQASPL